MLTQNRERDRKSFQDLAKLASSPSMTPKPNPSTSSSSSIPAPGGPRASDPGVSKSGRPSDPGDSGIVDLKMMAHVDPDASERAKSTPLAASGIFDEEAPRSAPSSRPAQAVTQTAPSSGRSAHAAGAKAEPKKGGGLFKLGGVVAIVAVAAAAVLMVRATKSQAPTALTPQPVQALPPPATPVAPAPTTATTAPTEAPQIVASADQTAVDPSKLPLAPAGKQGVPSKSWAPVSKAQPTQQLAVAAKPAPPAPVLPPSTVPSGTLGDELRKAAGPVATDTNTPTPAATGPAFAPGSVPEKPSQGAVIGALGAVKGAASACLDPDDPVSRASVVFQSDGSVQAVSVTGGAAGKPAEGCIKAALSKAKVPPFAQSTYTAHITIRP